MEYSSWITGAASITWYDDQGNPLDEQHLNNCGDIKFNGLIWENNFWNHCGGIQDQRRYLMRTDLTEKTGHIIATFPETLSIEWTIGIMADQTAQSVGMVFKATKLEDRTEVFIICLFDQNGWITEPYLIEDPKITSIYSQLLAMQWIDNKLTIPFYYKTYDEMGLREHGIILFSIAPTEPVGQRVLDNNLFYRHLNEFAIEAAYYDTSATLWHFLCKDYESSDVLDITETGELSQRYSSDDPRLEFFPYQVDYTSIGRPLDQNAKVILHSDGSLRMDPELPTLIQSFTPLQHYYEISNQNQQTHRPLFYGSSDSMGETNLPPNGFAQIIEDQWIYIYLKQTQAEEDSIYLALLDPTINDPQPSPIEHRIAVYNTECYELISGIAISQEYGYLMLNENGCYLQLDNDFKRLDQLSIWNYFASRGSTLASPSQWQYNFYLVWILAGLIGMILLFLITGLIHKTIKKSNNTLLIKHLSLGLLIYLIIGLIAGYNIYPLLQ